MGSLSALFMYLGPDNKLYIGNWGSVLCKQMSYFNNPDAKGLASDFCPRCLRFPNYGVTCPPTMPNYDLGEDLPCWPLSLPNPPKEGDEMLVVYPNPASSKLYIKYEIASPHLAGQAQGLANTVSS